MTGGRHEQPGGASRCREHQTLREHLPHQPRRPGTERRSHANLALARGAARQQQAGDVHARNQQHEADGADQRENRRPEIADQLLVEWHEYHGPARIQLRRLFRELGEHLPHLA